MMALPFRRTLAPLGLAALAVGLAVLHAGCGREPFREQEADRLLAKAADLADLGALHASADSARAALAIFTEFEREGRMADAERTLGDLAASAASFDSALVWYGHAVEHYRGQADRAATRSVQLTIADLYRQLGNEEEAFNRDDEALRVAGVVNDIFGVREITWAMLPLARTLDRTEVETRLLGDLMRAADSTGDRAFQARAHNEAGLSAFHHNDTAGAIRRFVEALGFSAQTGDSLFTATILRNLARAYEVSGAFNEAMTSYTDALQRVDRLPAGRVLREQMLMEVGNAMLRQRKPAEAVRFFQAASASASGRGNTLARCYALLQLSCALRAALPDSAAALARSALALLQGASPPAAESYAYGTLGLAVLAANRPAEALEAFRRAMESAETSVRRRTAPDLLLDCERAAVGGGKAPWHGQAIDLLLRLDRREEALTVALRRSAWLLFRDLSQLSPAALEGSLLDSWHSALAHRIGAEEQLDRALTVPSGRTERIAAVKAQLARASDQTTRFAAALIALRPTLAPFVSVAPSDVGTLQQRSADQTALVLWGTTRQTLHAFVISGKRIAAPVQRINRDQLGDLCRAYAARLQALGTGADSLLPAQMKKGDRSTPPEASVLFDLFIRPVERELAGMRAVLLAPSEDLPWIPLHALRRGTAAGTSLIERLPVSYVYPPLLNAAPAPSGPVKTPAAFGHPGTTGRDVEYELRDVRGFFRDAPFLVGPQAIVDSIAAMRGDLVHLALDLRWDPARAGNAMVALPDPRTGVVKGYPMTELTRITGFPSMAIFNCSGEAQGGASGIAALPLGAGLRAVILNGLATGRKIDKAFGEALYSGLQSGLAFDEAYRAALLDILPRKEVTLPYWASFALWER
ncbi:MAG TPA: CHAT domain-containing protein [Bacteroidota bacterium]